MFFSMMDRTAFAEAGFEYHSLTDFDSVARTAVETGYVSEGDMDQLIEFRNSL